MDPIKVPYVRQINDNACGPAALEMIYKYYGVQDVTQGEIFARYSELEPHGSGNFRVTTSNLVEDAQSRNFDAQWARVNVVNHNESMDELKTLTQTFKIPVIVCQKYSNKAPLIGHFRVVLGITDTEVCLHDPDTKIGGPFQKWPISKFMQFWQRTGENVTGGVMIVIRPTQ